MIKRVPVIGTTTNNYESAFKFYQYSNGGLIMQITYTSQDGYRVCSTGILMYYPRWNMKLIYY